jgi:hypothetical protein
MGEGTAKNQRASAKVSYCHLLPVAKFSAMGFSTQQILTAHLEARDDQF